MQDNRFNEISDAIGLTIKDRNTIVDKWPTRIKRKTNEAGAKEEFHRLLSTENTCMERWVEWERVREC